MKNTLPLLGSVAVILLSAQSVQATTYRHVLVTDGDYTLYHSLSTNGSYSTFSPVPNVPAGSTEYVGATTLHNGNLVVAYLSSNALYTITRNAAAGTWSAPEYALSGDHIPSITVGSDNTLYLCALNGSKPLPYYATKPVGGSWSSWKSIGSSYGPSSYQQMDCDITTEPSSTNALVQTDVLNVVATAHTIYHTRLKNGVWQTGWGNVTAVANPTCPELGTAGSFLHVEAAGVGGDLHMISTGYGCLQHTIRTAAGTWSQFGDVKGQAGDPGTVWWAAVSSEGPDLALIAGTMAPYRIWDTTRAANWSWSSFFDIGTRIGSSQMWFRPAVASYVDVVMK